MRNAESRAVKVLNIAAKQILGAVLKGAGP